MAADLETSPLSVPEQLIHVSEKPHTVKHWVSAIASKSPAGLVEDLLISRGVVHRDEVKVLVYFTSVRYPESNPIPERQIRSRVESVLAAAEPDERTAVLISLAQAGGLLSRLVDEVPKDRVKEISEGDTTSAAVKAADT